MKNIKTKTNDTFTSANGTVINFEEVFNGILSDVEYYGFTGGRGLGEADLEDLFQSAALKAIVSHKTYDLRKGSRPGNWGRTIAGNCERDAFNAAKRCGIPFSIIERTVEEGWSADECTILGYRGDEYESDAEICANEAEAYIMDRIGALNENYRLVIGLKSQGLKDREIAKITGWPPEKVHRTLCRARKALAESLGKEFMGEYGFAA